VQTSAAHFFYHPAVANLSFTCAFPGPYPKFLFFHHKSTANMSIFVANFVPFCRKFTTCFFFSHKLTTIFFLFTVNLLQMYLFTVLSVPVHRKFTASFPLLRQSLSVFIASLLQVFHFLLQICCKYALFYHKV